MTCNLDHAAIDAAILATPCPRCGAAAGLRCPDVPGYGAHQARLDAHWRAHSPTVYRLPSRRGEEGAVLS